MPRPVPKDPARRARRNKDPHPTTLIRSDHGEQPDLPAGIDWHPVTRAWWDTWRHAPQAEHFGTTDWAAAVTTARVHHTYWTKPSALLAAELRQREAKMGATIEDRLRLRMNAADADEKDAKRPDPAPSSRERRGTLHALKPASSDAVEAT